MYPISPSRKILERMENFSGGRSSLEFDLTKLEKRKQLEKQKAVHRDQSNKERREKVDATTRSNSIDHRSITEHVRNLVLRSMLVLNY